jgi:uncharacterized protein DUF6894
VPRYYFHLNSPVPSEDEQGIELADAAAARAEAVRLAREITNVHRKLSNAPSGDIVVTDASGEEVLTLSMSTPQRREPDRGGATSCPQEIPRRRDAA